MKNVWLLVDSSRWWSFGRNKMKKSGSLWLKGGLAGLAACASLYVFFLIVLISAPRVGLSPVLTNGTIYLSFITGHSYSLLNGFMVNTEPYCPNTVPVCTYWTAENGCEKQVMTPEANCRNTVEIFLFVFRTLILFLGYYVIGTFIGFLVQKYRDRKK
jgi:hypothetical protein